jgi:tripartite-type tricarboxylate transporter receptor subunit TctC
MERLLIGTVLAIVLSAGAAAQPWPSRPITMNVPYAAGGPLDTVMRVIIEGMRPSLGQPIVIENIAGGGGSIGVGRAARAAPDGYTLGAGNWASHVSNVAMYSLNYDVLKDLDPVTLLPDEPDLIIARRDFPAATLAGLIAWLKANPDQATAGTSGIGGPSYMSMAFFRQQSGTRFRLIPYRGSGPALLDLVAGQVDMMITGPAIALQQVRDGKVKAYAVTQRTRLASAPDIPTTDEAGLPGFYFTAWTGLWVPHGTPKEIVARLNTAVRDALVDPGIRERLTTMGLEIPPADQLGPEALATLHRAEVAKWVPIIKAANIKPE